jgi:hypothetical protein
MEDADASVLRVASSITCANMCFSERKTLSRGRLTAFCFIR